jgi:Zn-dependent membrane protease YugP
MRIGSSIALIVIGAIVAFALDIQLAGVDLRLIGYILMAAGVVLLIISLAVAFGGRRTTTTTRSGVDPASGEQITQQDRRDGTY